MKFAGWVGMGLGLGVCGGFMSGLLRSRDVGEIPTSTAPPPEVWPPRMAGAHRTLAATRTATRTATAMTMRTPAGATSGLRYPPGADLPGSARGPRVLLATPPRKA